MKRKLLLASATLLLCCGSVVAQPASFSEPRLFINSDRSLMSPVWSPDGSQLAVTGDNFVGIYVANVDGTGLTQVSNAAGAGYRMTWADDATITATPYTLVNGRKMTRVEQINVSTGDATIVAPATRDFKPGRVSGQPTLCQQMLDEPLAVTSNVEALSEYAGKMVINPTLSPDGSKVAFQIAGQGLFVINADATGLTALGKGSHASWLPDNRHIMAARISDNGHQFTESNIFCIDTTTGAATNVTPHSDLIPVTLAVSPDGSKVAFDNDTDGCIYIIDLTY